MDVDGVWLHVDGKLPAYCVQTVCTKLQFGDMFPFTVFTPIAYSFPCLDWLPAACSAW